MKSSKKSNLKNSVESLSSGMDQIEVRLSGLEDKVDVLEHANTSREKYKEV
jgi:hypothetical protein